jgi:transposase
MATTQSEVEQTTLAEHELRPKRLDDIEAVRAYLTDLLEKGRGKQALEMVLDLLVRLRDSHTAVSVRLHDALRQLYGRRSEKLSPNQLDLFLSALVQRAGPAEQAQPDAEQAAPPDGGKAQNKQRAKRPRGPRGRAVLPEHLERRVVTILPEPEQCVCAKCDAQKEPIGVERSERLDFEPACFFVRVEERPVLGCPKCRNGVVCAPAGETPLEGSLPGPGLLAQILTAKFKDGLPVYRQQKIYEQRYKVRIPTSTLGDWIMGGAGLLLPLVPLLKERTLKAFLLKTDDTGVLVLDSDDPRGRKRGHLWVYRGQGGDLFVEFTPSWSAEGPQAILKQRVGYIQCDGYAGYDALFGGESPRTEIGCWMHGRRGFEKAYRAGDSRGGIILELIQKLYAVERQADQEAVDETERLRRRLEQSAPVYEEIFELLDRWAPEVPPKTPLGKAIGYARNRRVQLGRFLEDGRIGLDNGEVERLIRLIAVGRRNYLFFGSDEGARRAAAVYTLILSCQCLGIDPWEYFRDVLPKLGASDFPHRRLAELLPEEWQKRRLDAG